MPLMSTRGAASATGFGLFGRTVTLNITTVTYTSSTTWVCPGGVSNIVTLTGKGQDASGDYWVTGNATWTLIYPYNVAYSGGTNDWSYFYNLALADLAVLNAGSGIRSITGTRFNSQIGNNNQFGGMGGGPFSFTGRGSYTLVGQGGPQTSGQVLYSQISGNVYSGWIGYGDVLSSAVAGANTTAFGYTFLGGTVNDGPIGSRTGNAATPVTYNNIAVTQGTGYALSIPSGGSVSISYLTPA